VPELLIVTEVGVVCKQVASPLVGPLLLTVVCTGSDVDQAPKTSAIKGQLPCTFDTSENCTRFPGAAALWSADADAGTMLAVMLQGSIESPEQPVMAPTISKIDSQRVFPINTFLGRFRKELNCGMLRNPPRSRLLYSTSLQLNKSDTAGTPSFSHQHKPPGLEPQRNALRNIFYRVLFDSNNIFNCSAISQHDKN